MDCTRNKSIELIKYIKSFGLKVNLNTQARGHQGFFLKDRIDISKKIPQNRIIPTLLHEFTHFIYTKDEIFNTENIEEELFNVTNFVDENSKFTILKKHKEIIRTKIQEQEKIIKKEYPNFQRSKGFKEFEKYIRHSKAKYSK